MKELDQINNVGKSKRKMWPKMEHGIKVRFISHRRKYTLSHLEATIWQTKTQKGYNLESRGQ